MDFLTQIDNAIVPIEVKADTNARASSLQKYREKYGDRTPVSVRFSLKNLSFDGGVLNVPLFLAGQLVQLLNSCQEN